MFSVILLAVLVVALELLSLAAFPLVLHRGFHRAELAAQRAAAMQVAWQATDGADPRDQPREILHPYLGYVTNPALPSVGEEGFHCEPPALRHRSAGQVLIGIFGGSVARDFAQDGGTEPLGRALGQLDEYAGRELVFLNYAIGGYKQPQQYFALSYLLALGGELDVVVNLDGFNEIALHREANGRTGVAPIFPRAWAARVRTVDDVAAQRLAGTIGLAQERRAAWARWFDAAPLRWSVTASLVWSLYDRARDSELVRLQGRLQTLRTAESWVVTGPRTIRGVGGGAVDEELVAIWTRCSIQMHRLCRANGIRYIHALQPNQYLPGSKPMGEEERRVAIHPDCYHARSVPACYPMLSAAGAEQLRIGAGVAFYDLTMVFRDVEEPLYCDICCHLVRRGNELLGAALGQMIVDDSR
ncbi:MAG: hypothetical protein IPM29_24845 [Planctomycetes bacterium]|nr:hypothetical protein [Planctomycetota bacterium]